MNCKFINDARSVKVKNSTNDIAKLQIKNKLSEPEEFLYVKILLSLQLVKIIKKYKKKNKKFSFSSNKSPNKYVKKTLVEKRNKVIWKCLNNLYLSM